MLPRQQQRKNWNHQQKTQRADVARIRMVLDLKPNQSGLKKKKGKKKERGSHVHAHQLFSGSSA